MRKLIFGICFILLAIVGIYIYVFSDGKVNRTFDKKVTFKKTDIRPYGTKVLYDGLKQHYANKNFVVNKTSPSDWFTFDSSSEGNQLFFLHSNQFEPDSYELEYLSSYIDQGNTVFITSSTFGKDVIEFLNLKVDQNRNTFFEQSDYIDSVNVSLNKPVFASDTTYLNFGYTSGTYFYKFDSTKAIIAGSNHEQLSNFLVFKIGKGKLYLHSDPFLFSNYFILKDGNSDYLQKCLALFPSNCKKIIWDEYYTKSQTKSDKGKKSPLRVLFSYPAFSWAFWLLIIIAILYGLINLKRKERFIKHEPPPVNDSIEFAKTIGRLYHEQSNHLNLAKKMVTYFLEHVRNKYFINTSDLNENFIEKLSGKSGYHLDNTKQLVDVIIKIKNINKLSEAELNKIYLQFQQFYQLTT